MIALYKQTDDGGFVVTKRAQRITWEDVGQEEWYCVASNSEKAIEFPLSFTILGSLTKDDEAFVEGVMDDFITAIEETNVLFGGGCRIVDKGLLIEGHITLNNSDNFFPRIRTYVAIKNFADRLEYSIEGQIDNESFSIEN